MSVESVTANIGLRKPYYDQPQWHVFVNENWDIIDTLFSTLTRITGLRGTWQNATAYVQGQRAIDDDTNTLYEVLVDHTSASTGTFTEDRADNPTYWGDVTSLYTINGRAIHEVVTVTDAQKEFVSGGTFTVNPLNPRHYYIKVGDSSNLLTAHMTIDLDPTSDEWTTGSKITIIKGDTSPYHVIVSGFDVDGLGTYTLKSYRSGTECSYQTTDTNNGPGEYGQKFERGLQVGDAERTLYNASIGPSGLSAENVQEAIDELKALIDAIETSGIAEVLLTTAIPTPSDASGTLQLSAAHFSASASDDTLTLRPSVTLTAETETLLLPNAAPIGTRIVPQVTAAHASDTVVVQSGTYDLVQSGDTDGSTAVITSISGNGGTAHMAVGDVVNGTNIPTDSVILTVDSSTQITIDGNTTGAGTSADLTVKVARNVFGLGGTTYRTYTQRKPISTETSIMFDLVCNSLEGEAPWSPARWVTSERVMVVSGYYEPDAGGNITGATVVDVGAQSTVRGTLTGNVTFTMDGLIEDYGNHIFFDLTQGGSGGYTITITDIAGWIGGAPTFPTDVGDRVFFSIIIDGEGDIIGSYAGAIEA